MRGGRKQRIHTGLAQRRHAPAQLKSQPRNATEAEREEEQGRPGVIVRFSRSSPLLSFVRTGVSISRKTRKCEVANASAFHAMRGAEGHARSDHHRDREESRQRARARERWCSDVKLSDGLRDATPA